MKLFECTIENGYYPTTKFVKSTDIDKAKKLLLEYMQMFGLDGEITSVEEINLNKEEVIM